MAQRLYRIYLFASAVLCALALLSWARSLVSAEGVYVGRGTFRSTVVASEAVLVIDVRRMAFDDDAAAQRWRDRVDPDHSRDWTHWRMAWLHDMNGATAPERAGLGFGFDHYDGPPM